MSNKYDYYNSFNWKGFNQDISLLPSRGWVVKLDDSFDYEKSDPFFWVTAQYEPDPEKVLTLCVRTTKTDEITPVFVKSYIPFPIKGLTIQSKGKDKSGEEFITTPGITRCVVYGGSR